MRTINQFHVHHAGADFEDLLEAKTHIHHWHTARGWRGIGYTFIGLGTKVYHARPIAERPASIKGHNENAVAYCIARDLTTKLPSVEEVETLIATYRYINAAYGPCTIIGHNEVAETICPGPRTMKLIRDAL